MALSPSFALAAEPTVDQCVAASENAQRLRRAGKLRASRAGFQSCSADSCPAVVRADCTEQLRAVTNDLATVIFVRADGASPFNVSMDGEPLDERVGDAYVVDPGEHSFTFTAADHGAVLKQLSLRPGERGRRESVPFAVREVPAPPTQPSSALIHDLGYAGVGAGALGLTMGIVFGIVAKTTYDDAQTHCHAAACDVDGVAGGRSAHALAGVATAGFITGAGLLVGGVALLLLGPRSSSVALANNGRLVW